MEGVIPAKPYGQRYLICPVEGCDGAVLGPEGRENLIRPNKKTII